MEKEIISFERFDLPIKVHHFHICKHVNLRGMHSHKAIEIVKVKNGVLYCHVNDKVIRIFSGQVIFINSNVGHKLVSDDADISCLQVDVDLTENIPNGESSELYSFISHRQAKPYSVFERSEELEELLNKIDKKYYDGSMESYWYIKAYIYELIAFMYSHSFISELKFSKEKLKKLEQAVDYIERNFRSPITLEDICLAAKYNKYTVCHMFKSVTGFSVFDYVNFLRMSYAAERLKEPKNTVLDISVESGFSSATYFNRVFKSFYGCSPSVYRKLSAKK